MLLSNPSNLELQFGKSRWSLPAGLLGLWAIQSTQFQKDNDIYSERGFFSFLGWFIHHFDHQLVYHRYIATLFSQKNSCLRALVAGNLISNINIYIPIFFYLIYYNRQDLQDSFNISTTIGRLSFFQWAAMEGHQEYATHPIYANNIFQSVTVDVSPTDRASALEIAEFDESWYLQNYPDVRAAVDAGIVNSGLDHWNDFGNLEKRLPHSFSMDESWYLDAYPDINEQIKNKALVSATEHWILAGYYEGRLPYSPEIIPFKLNV